MTDESEPADKGTLQSLITAEKFEEISHLSNGEESAEVLVRNN